MVESQQTSQVFYKYPSKSFSTFFRAITPVSHTGLFMLGYLPSQTEKNTDVIGIVRVPFCP